MDSKSFSVFSAFFTFMHACPHTHANTHDADTNTLVLKHGKLEGQVEVLINIH